MASHIVQMLELTLANNDNTKQFTILLHPDIYQRCTEEADLASSLFKNLEGKYEVDDSGKRTLTSAESLIVVSEMGLLGSFREAAKGHGVSINNTTRFDRLTQVARITNTTKFDETSQAAYNKKVSDGDLHVLAKLAPADLSSREKVRFMELLAATLPEVPAAAAASAASLSDNKEVEIQEPREPSRFIGKPASTSMDMDVLDDTESIFSMSSAMTSETTMTSDTLGSNRVHWSHEEVLLLVELRRQHANLFSNSTVTTKQAWRKVAEEMAAKGHPYTGDDCDKKFRSMRSRHKTIKDRSRKTGQNRQCWRYFQLMEEMFAKDPAVQPLVEAGSIFRDAPTKRTSTEVTPTRNEESQITCESPMEESALTPTRTPRRRSSCKSDSSSEIAELRADLNKMHKERMEVEQRRLDIESQRLTALQSLVEVLKENSKK